MNGYRKVFMVVISLCLTTAIVDYANAQVKPSASGNRKAVVKPPVQPTKGTVQMAGGNGVLGTEYTIGKARPMNILIVSAEYRLDRWRVGNNATNPTLDQKLLVIHFVLHNPNPRMELVRFDTFKFTAVDLKGANHEYENGIWTDPAGDEIDLSLKPGQKQAGYTVIKLPAQGDIEKLMVISPDNITERYALTGKVKPLALELCEANDKSGANASNSIPGKIGQTLSMSPREHQSRDYFDLVIEKMEMSADKVLADGPEEGKRFMVVTARAINVSQSDNLTLRGDSLATVLISTEGEKFPGTQTLAHATQPREIDTSLTRGTEVRFRVWFVIPKDVKVKAILVKTNNADDRPFTIPFPTAP